MSSLDAPGPDAPSLDAVVDALAVSVRSDGADLSAERSGQVITFTLHIPDQACAECVMPSSMLLPMFQRRVDDDLGPGWSVAIDDPRD